MSDLVKLTQKSINLKPSKVVNTCFKLTLEWYLAYTQSSRRFRDSEHTQYSVQVFL